MRLHIHLYGHVGDKGCYSYDQCRCGRRRVRRSGRGWTPVDHGWLAGRRERDDPTPLSLPPKPSDAGRSARP